VKPQRIAVIGAGIAGLHTAWRLAPDHEVTVFERHAHAGGHAHTVDVSWQGRAYAIDTGFIVFNDVTYPHFRAMLHALDVRAQPSSMSFSLRCERSGLEYNGTSLDTLFAQRRNLLRPAFLRMLLDILRFNTRCRELLERDADGLILEDYLAAGGYSRAFIEQYVLPMGRAIWSAEADAILGFPARFFVEFFDRHGFLNVNDRPAWHSVAGGSRTYVRAIERRLGNRLQLSAPVQSIRRTPRGILVQRSGFEPERFDAVFLACHSDEALALLADPTPTERTVLGALPYVRNLVTLHTDERVLPRTPGARAAWNYHLRATPKQPVAVTYDMNVLQALEAPVRFLVSLNYDDHIAAAQIIDRFEYAHPVYRPDGVAAQHRHRELNGRSGTYFCGAYWRYGFHEDGVASSIAAIAHFNEDLAENPGVKHAEPSLQRVG
jgi:predicted NAD/FAD-binding protein